MTAAGTMRARCFMETRLRGDFTASKPLYVSSSCSSAPRARPTQSRTASVEIVCCNVRAAVAVDSSKDLHKSCGGWNLLRYGRGLCSKSESGLRLAQLGPDIREVVRPGAFRVGFERLPLRDPAPEPFKCSRIPGHQHPVRCRVAARHVDSAIQLHQRYQTAVARESLRPRSAGGCGDSRCGPPGMPSVCQS